MAKVFRSMLPANDGLPECRNDAKGLGVRAATDQPRPALIDITPDTAGYVAPPVGGSAAEGMSVAQSWFEMPPHRIPKRLRDVAPFDAEVAAGRDDFKIFSHGAGAFQTCPVAQGLHLHITATRPWPHGILAPAQRMQLADYRTAIAGTRSDWQVDEP
jgi:hypothetical protein